MVHDVDIEIISDTVCPWCFIGKRQLERAVQDMQEVRTRVSWKPYFLDPSVPREGVDAREYLAAKFGHPDAAERLRGRIRSVAQRAGIQFDMKAQARRPNTLDSHRVIHWAGEQGVQDAVVEGLFQGYFERGKDIGDRDVLAAVAGAAGMDEDRVRTRLETDDDTEQIREQVERVRDMGITSVPTFSIGGFLLPGAQEPDLFQHVIQRVIRKRQAESAG